MKKSEMSKKIARALSKGCWCGNTPGELCQTCILETDIALETVLENDMLPPTNTCRFVPDEKRPGMMKHSECKREWDDESEPQS